MTDYLSAYAISASGMAVERLRLEVAASNLANAHTTKSPEGGPYRPLRVIAHAANSPMAFEQMLDGASPSTAIGSIDVVKVDAGPRLEYDPGNPDADAKGFVALPQINPLDEMVNIVNATRAYEADVRAMNAAKAMALKALEIGDSRS